jgi:hypothetical protein
MLWLFRDYAADTSKWQFVDKKKRLQKQAPSH